MSSDYDQTTCRHYLAGSGDAVLPRTEQFFIALDTKRAHGEPAWSA